MGKGVQGGLSRNGQSIQILHHLVGQLLISPKLTLELYYLCCGRKWLNCLKCLLELPLMFQATVWQGFTLCLTLWRSKGSLSADSVIEQVLYKIMIKCWDSGCICVTGNVCNVLPWYENLSSHVHLHICSFILLALFYISHFFIINISVPFPYMLVHNFIFSRTPLNSLIQLPSVLSIHTFAHTYMSLCNNKDMSVQGVAMACSSILVSICVYIVRVCAFVYQC